MEFKYYQFTDFVETLPVTSVIFETIKILSRTPKLFGMVQTCQISFSGHLGCLSPGSSPSFIPKTVAAECIPKTISRQLDPVT